MLRMAVVSCSYCLRTGEESVVSIKDIAKMAGVSASTVSRVLNDPSHRCSSDEVRRRIWRIASEQNYLPNQAARNLKLGRSDADAEAVRFVDVLMTRTDKRQDDPFFDELLRMVESEIHANRCILTNVFYEPTFSNDRLCRASSPDRLVDGLGREGSRASSSGHGDSHGADGLVVIGRCNQQVLARLVARYGNVVSINRNPTNHAVDEVTCDGGHIASIAVGHLIGLGHARIGYVGNCQGEARYRGYQETMLCHHLDCDPDNVIECGQTEADGYEAMGSLIERDDPPTAIYCANDILAIGMLKRLAKRRGRRYVPSIISSDDIEEAQFARPMLTTVRLPKRDMARFALRLLVDRINGGHTEVTCVELTGRLVERASCHRLEVADSIEYVI